MEKYSRASSERTPDVTSRSSYVFINILLLTVKLSIQHFKYKDANYNTMNCTANYSIMNYSLPLNTIAFRA